MRKLSFSLRKHRTNCYPNSRSGSIGSNESTLSPSVFSPADGGWAGVFDEIPLPSAPEEDLTSSTIDPSIWSTMWYRFTCTILVNTYGKVPDDIIILGLWKSLYHYIPNSLLGPTLAVLLLGSEVKKAPKNTIDQVPYYLCSCLSFCQEVHCLKPEAPFSTSGPVSTLVKGKILEGQFQMKVESSSGGFGTSTFSKLLQRNFVDPESKHEKINWREKETLQVINNNRTRRYLKSLGMIEAN